MMIIKKRRGMYIDDGGLDCDDDGNDGGDDSDTQLCTCLNKF